MRIGPNKVLAWGVAQPLIDGVKLLKKTFYLNIKTQYLIFWLFCVFVLMLTLANWFSVPYKYWSNKRLVFLWVFVLISLNRYFLLYLGLFSGRNFAQIGRIRRVSQAISLEILLLIRLIMVFCISSKTILYMQHNNNTSITLIPLILMFFVFVLVDTHRAPIDLREGERELVRGFNTEYRRFFFTLIFLREYGNIILMVSLLLLLFFYINFISLQILIFFLMIIRSCFPRCRYDFLIGYCWIKVFPIFTIFCTGIVILKIL